MQLVAPINPKSVAVFSFILLVLFKLNNRLIFFTSRWQPFNSKKRNVGTAFCEEGTTKYPYKYRHTHAKRREHLMCLLLYLFNKFWSFYFAKQ